MRSAELKWFNQCICPTPHFPCAHVKQRSNAALLDSLYYIAFCLSLNKQVLLAGGFLNTSQAAYHKNTLTQGGIFRTPQLWSIHLVMLLEYCSTSGPSFKTNLLPAHVCFRNCCEREDCFSSQLQLHKEVMNGGSGDAAEVYWFYLMERRPNTKTACINSFGRSKFPPLCSIRRVTLKPYDYSNSKLAIFLWSEHSKRKGIKMADDLHSECVWKKEFNCFLLWCVVWCLRTKCAFVRSWKATAMFSSVNHCIISAVKECSSVGMSNMTSRMSDIGSIKLKFENYERLLSLFSVCSSPLLHNQVNEAWNVLCCKSAFWW